MLNLGQKTRSSKYLVEKIWKISSHFNLFFVETQPQQSINADISKAINFQLNCLCEYFLRFHIRFPVCRFVREWTTVAIN